MGNTRAWGESYGQPSAPQFEGSTWSTEDKDRHELRKGHLSIRIAVLAGMRESHTLKHVIRHPLGTNNYRTTLVPLPPASHDMIRSRNPAAAAADRVVEWLEVGFEPALPFLPR